MGYLRKLLFEQLSSLFSYFTRPSGGVSMSGKEKSLGDDDHVLEYMSVLNI